MAGQIHHSAKTRAYPSGDTSLVLADLVPRLALNHTQSKSYSIYVNTVTSGYFADSYASSNAISAIVTLVIGQEQRIFAAHENVLSLSPFFQSVLQNQMMDSQTKKISLPDEEPEIFSSVLEYLYKGDYYPRLVHNKKRNSWELEQPVDDGRSESTIYHQGVDGELLKDTVIYCAAEKYGLEELKRVALRKQGLRKSPMSSLSMTLH